MIAAPMIPHLRQVGTSQQLFVHGKPLLMLGGEVQNSQFSSARYISDVWARLKAANINTAFGAVAWEQIEPVEDQFIFEELDQIVYDARKHGLHLVLLWFGGFKNALSTYAPAWVKKNPRRFPRAEICTEDNKQVIADAVSIFATATRDADAKAFATLMKHLKEIDEYHSTVVMVQVENECGLLGDSMDRSRLATEAWQRPVPSKLLQDIKAQWSTLNNPFQTNLAHLQQVNTIITPTWADLIHEGDDLRIHELFMAYHFSQYVETVAAAGKAVFPLPLYTNVWQNYAGEDRDTSAEAPAIVAGGGKPGDYPSGGGVTNVLDVWKMSAPSLDLIAPDIYLNDYAASCAAYRHRGQALLIPEQRRDEYGARRIWTAFGSYNCIGTAPFGIDTLELEENPFQRHYGLLASVSKHVIDAQARGNACAGFFFDELHQDGSDPCQPIQLTFGEWNLLIERSFVFGRPSAGSGMVIHLTQNEFLLVGWGFQVSFKSRNTSAIFCGLLRFEEREITNSLTGEMRALRLFNGDETRSGKSCVMPSRDPDYGGFPIAITIPAHTGIALCEPYMLIGDSS